MVTNVPFYSFKDVGMKRSVPFAVVVLLALGIALINIDPPTMVFSLICGLRAEVDTWSTACARHAVCKPA